MSALEFKADGEETRKRYIWTSISRWWSCASGSARSSWRKGSRGGIEFPLALLVGAFAVQVLGPGEWSLDALLPAVDKLYEPAVRWVILALAVAGALVAAFWPAPPQPEAPAPTEGAPQ